jgi:hypothetical protein
VLAGTGALGGAVEAGAITGVLALGTGDDAAALDAGGCWHATRANVVSATATQISSDARMAVFLGFNGRT